jgi:hypothetical protein
LQLDYDHSIDVDLQQNNAFFCKPDTVWVYLDSKKIEVECRN